MDENQLIALAQKGDMQAFQKLLERYENKIYAVALRFCRNSEDAWDVAQEAAIKIYRALAKYHGRSAFSTWTYAITKNTALDFLRKRSKMHGREYSMEASEFHMVFSEAHGEDFVEQRERLKNLLTLIEALPEPQRKVIILRDIDGYSYEEIAQILAVSKGTVKSRLSRARETIRRNYLDEKE